MMTVPGLCSSAAPRSDFSRYPSPAARIFSETYGIQEGRQLGERNPALRRIGKDKWWISTARYLEKVSATPVNQPDPVVERLAS